MRRALPLRSVVPLAAVAVLALAAPVAAAPAGSVAASAPQLRGRAILPATLYQPGPVSGTLLPTTPVNGVTPPFPGQPVPGFSAVLPAVPGDRSGRHLLAMPDNGFGTKTNSADFLLRAYFKQRVVTLLDYMPVHAVPVSPPLVALAAAQVAAVLAVAVVMTVLAARALRHLPALPGSAATPGP